MYFNSNVTYFNKTAEDTFKKYFLRDIYLDTMSGVRMTSNGQESVDNATIITPLDKICFRPTREDFFVKGLINDKITDFAELQNKYEDCYKVANYTKLDMGSQNAQHWEIVGS